MEPMRILLTGTIGVQEPGANWSRRSHRSKHDETKGCRVDQARHPLVETIRQAAPEARHFADGFMGVL